MNDTPIPACRTRDRYVFRIAALVLNRQPRRAFIDARPMLIVAAIGLMTIGTFQLFDDSRSAVAESTCASSIENPRSPGPPRNVAAEFVNGSFRMSWTAPSDVGNPSLSGYRVYWDPAEPPLDELPTTTGRDVPQWKGIGTTHTLKVAAVNCAGLSEQASVDALAAELPSAPSMFAVEIAGTFAIISWKAPTSSGSARNINGFVVTYETGDDTTTVELARNIFEHILSGLTPGASYRFRLAAKSIYGTGTEVSTTATIPLPSDAPRSFSATYASGQIVVTWRAPASSASVTGYRLKHTVGGTTTTTDLPSSSVRHTVSSPSAGVSYTFRLAALTGGSEGTSVSATVTIPSQPGAPTGLSAEMSGGDLAVTWSAPTASGRLSVTGYKVSWAVGQTTGSATTSALVLSYTITSPTRGSTVAITVTAISALGAGSSATTSYTVPAPPSAPRNLSLTMSSGNLLVSWSPPAQAGTASVTGYLLNWSYDSTTDSVRLGGSSRSHTITSPVAGKKYTVSLSATNSAGAGPVATASLTVPAPPGAPRNLSARASGSGLTLSWTSPSYGGTSAITGYSLKWKFGTPEQSGSATVGSDASSYTITSVVAGATYQLSLTASNSVGAGSAASLSYTIPSPPGNPRDLDAEIQSNGDFRVSWKSPTYSGTSPITKYKLSWTVGSSLTVSSIETTALQHDISSPSLGSTYAFTLVAINAVGSGSSATLNAVVPSPPGKVSNLATEMSGTGLAVSWGAPTYAGTTALTGYVLSWVTGSMTTSKSLSADTKTYTIPEVLQGHAYTVTVSARNSVGTGASSSIQFTVPQPPGTPRNLTAKMSAGALVLAWQAPTVAGTSAISAYSLSWTVDAVTTTENLLSTARRYSIASPARGKRYQFSLRAVNAAGTGHNADISFTVPQPPGAPTGLTASIDANGRLTVAWSAPAASATPAIKHYALSWTVTGSTTGGSVQVGVNARSHTILTPTKGATYTFSVAGVSDAGTGPSSSVGYTVPKLPSAPRQLSATLLANGGLRVSWSSPTDLGTPTLSGYRLSWTVNAGTGSATKAADQRSHVISSPVAGATYSFSVISYNSGGNSPAATLDYTVPAVPGSPREFAAEFSAGKVRLSWKNPTYAGVPALSGYLLFWSVRDPRTAQVTRGSATLVASKRAHELTNAAAGSKYQFSLVARNSTGDSSSVTASVTVPSVPDAPRNLDAELESDGDLAVTWDAPAYAGTAPITGYKVSWSAGQATGSGTTAASVLRYTITSPTRGSTVDITVAAVSTLGNGSSATVSYTVPAPPSAPRNLALTMSGGNLQVSWSAPAQSGTAAVSGYVLKWQYDNVASTVTLAASARSHTITSPVAGKAYTVTLSATNAAGDGPAATESATVPAVPGAPRNLSASVSGSSLAVSWSAPSYGGTSAITGYSLKWKYGTPQQSGSASLGAGDTSHTITSVTAGATYVFSLTASNSVGAGSAATSSYTVPSPPGMPRDLDAEIQSNGDFRVSWKSPTYAGTSPITKYKLSWTVGSSSVVSSIETTALRHDITSPSLGSTHAFTLVAINVVGSGPSATFNAVVPSPPGKVTSLAAEMSGIGLAVSWDAPTYAGTTALTGYVLSWVTGSTTTSKSLGVDTTSYTIPEVVQGSAYTVSVAAKNSVGSGASSSVAFTVPQPPGTPRNFTAEMSGGALVLAWQAPTAAGTSAVSGYALSWTVDSVTTNENLGAAIRGYSISSPASGARYQFSLRAVSAAGTGHNADISFTVPQPPGAPTNLTASVNANGKLKVAWSAPAAVATPAVKHYALSWTVTGSTAGGAVQVGVNTRSHTISTPTKGATYTFSVAGVSDAGTGPTATISFTVPKPPGAPRDLAAVVVANGKLQVSWSAPTDLGTPTLSGYRVSWTVDTTSESATKAANQRSHAISAPVAGATYSFSVISYNSGGDSPTSTLDYTVPAVPGIPRDFAAAIGAGKVTASWKNPTYAGVPELSGYVLTWSIRNPRTDHVTRGTASLTASKRAHALANAAAGSKYQFSLVARNSTGDSAPVTASVTVPSAPDAPRNLDAELGASGDLDVTWDAPEYAGTAPITGYKLSWTVGGDTLSATTDAATRQHTISSPSRGSRYALSVKATNSVGDSDATTHYIVIPAPPTAPRDLSLTMSSGNLQVSWSPPAQVGTSAVTGYFLKWKYDSTTNSARLGGSARSHTITSPVAGKEYTVSLSATSAAGAGPTATASITVPAVPGAPRNLSASVSGSDLVVSWSAPSYGGTSAITGYTLTWKFGMPQQSGSTSLGAGDLSHAITSVTAGATYAISLTASNSLGAGTAATLSYTVPSSPGMPRDLDAEIQSNGDFRVSWKSPTYAGTSPITKYKLSWTVGSSSVVSSIETTALRHDITSPSLGSTYAFNLVAINAVGSGPSATLNAVVPSPPGKVSNLAAEMSGSGLAVSWDAPTYAGTTALTGYVLSWATGSTPTSKSLSAETTTHTIPEVVQGSTYTVTVAAKNSVGSGASSSVEFTVPQPPGTPRNFTAEMSGGALVLAWQAPTAAGTSAVSGYALSWTVDSVTTNENLGAAIRGYSITSPASGKRYQFSLRAVSAAGIGHNADISFTVPQPPGAPTGLTASVDANGRLKVAWSAPAASVTPAIKHYALSWTVTGSTASGAVQVGVDARSHTILTPTKGATYTFSVAGVSDAGTGPSSSVSYTVPKPPSAPRDLAATSLANGGLRVSWSAPADLGTPSLSGYRLSWTVDAGTGSASKTANQRSHAISSPVGGATYSFSVISYNSGGDSPAATLDYTVPAVPGSPRDFVAVFGTGKVTASWKNPTYAGVPELSGYVLTWSIRNPRTDHVTRGSASLTASKRAHALTNAAAGSKYQFALVARNSTGNGAAVTASVTVPSAPDAPRNLDAELESDGDLAISWDAPEYAGTAPITGYALSWTVGGDTMSATTDAATRQHTISSPGRGSRYDLSVKATNSVGDSDATTHYIVIPAPPTAPRNLSLTMSSGNLQVSWSPPAQSGTAAVTGYFLKWKYDSTTSSARLGGNSRSHTITSPVAGKEYTVSLSATSSAGDGPAATASFTVPSAPGAPRSLNARVSGSDLVVSWSAPSYGGTSAITGYTLTWKFGMPQQSGSATVGADSLSHTIASVVGGATYRLSLTASNSVGAGPVTSTSYTIPSRPGKPRDLDAEIQSNGKFRVSWKSPSYAGTSAITKYRLTWTVGGSSTVSSVETTALWHDISSPTLGSTYAFNLVAINAVGSSPSATLDTTVPSPPGKVSNLTAEMSVDGLSVSWDAPSYSGTTQLSGYIVSWGTGGTTSSKSLGATATAYTIPEVVQGSAYTVTVTAKNSVGNGAGSSIVFTVPQPPGTPRNLTTKMSGGALVVTWEAPTVAGTSAITGYSLSWTVDGETSTKALASTARKYSISSPAPRKRYQLSLRAVSAAGTGHNADTSFTVPQPPGAPTDLTASVGANGKLKVAWSAPAVAVTPAIKHYALSWTVTGSTTGGSVQVGINVRTHTISAPTKGATYTFSVSGVSDAGNGPSAAISFTVPKPPGAPRNLSTSILTNGDLQVSWSAPTEVGTPSLSGYRVSWAVGDSSGSATKAAGQRSHAISSPVAGATYSFSVAAYNTGGNSPASMLDYTVPAIPGSPRDFTAEFSAGNVAAAWKYPTYAGVPALSSYTISWSIRDPRTDQVTRGTASLGPSKHAHTLTNAAAGSKYQFTLVARNSTGDSAAVTASVTVPSAPDAPRNLDAELESDGDLAISWDAPEYTGTAPITGYALSWTVGGDTMSATTDAATRQHTISSPSPGSRYDLSVKATNSVGDSTAATNYFVVPAPPDSPMDLAWEMVTNDGVDSLRITWDVPASSGTSSIKGYVVQYTVGEVTATKSLGATARSYTIDEPVPGGQYAINLSVQTNDGMAAASLTFTYPKPPDAPRAFNAKLDDSGNIALAWNAPLNSGTSSITSYELKVNVGTTTSQGDVTSTNRLNATARTHTIADPDAGKTYRFGLMAVSNAGKSSTAEATLTVPDVPGMPRAVASVIDDNGDLVVTWTAPSNRNESALTGYALTWRRGSEAGSASVADASSPRFVVDDPVAGSTYDFEIKSVGPVGESSAAMLSVTVPAPPGAPRDFAATVRSGEVILTWDPPAEAGTAELQGFALTWSIVGEDSADSRGNVTRDAETTSFTLASPRYGLTYAFTLRAVTGDGAGPAVAVRYRVPTVPGMPSSLSASYSDGTTTLRWDRPVSDGGIAVAGYEVSWEPITGTGYRSVGSDQLSFAVPDTQLGIVYRFAVVARNAVGRGPIATLDYEVSTGEPSGKTFDDNPRQLPLNFSATFLDGVARFAWRTPEVVVGNPVVRIVLSWSATNHDHFATVDLPAVAVGHELSGLRRGAEYSISLVVVRQTGTQSPIARFFTVPDLQNVDPTSGVGPVETVVTILDLREHRLPRRTVRVTPSRWSGPANLEIYQQGESVQVYWNEPEGREPLGWTVDWTPDPPDFPAALPGSSRNYGILGTKQAESRVVKVRAVYSDGLSSRAKATLSFSPDISASVAPRSDMLALAHGFGTQTAVQGHGMSARISAPANGVVQGDRVKLKLTFALMPRIGLEGYMPECDEMSLKVEAEYAPVRKRADSEATRYRMLSPLKVCLTDSEGGLGLGDAVSSVVLATRSGSAEVLDSETVRDGEQVEICATVGTLELGEPMYLGLVSRDTTDTMDTPALEVRHGFSALVLLFVNWILATTRRRW